MNLKTKLITLSLLTAFAASAAQAAFTPIKVNSELITVDEQEQLAKHALSQLEDPHSVLMDPKKGQEFEEQARTMAIESHVMAQVAKENGWDKLPEIQKGIEQIRNRVLSQVYISNYVEKHPVTNEEIEKAYNEAKASYGTREVRLRHILVDNETVAKTLLDDMKAGKPMAELAQANSLDKQSGPKGGLLDWNSPNIYPPEMAAAVAKMKFGDTTKAPVKTDEGWEIIRLEGERDAKNFPPLDKELKQKLYRELTQRRVGEFIASLQPTATKKPLSEAQIDEIVAKKAEAEGFDKFKQVKTELDNQVTGFLMATAINKQLEKMPITDKELKAEYDRAKGDIADREVQLRQIVVKDEATALKLLKDIEGGASMADLAKKYSIDKDSAQKGGLTDWLEDNRLVSSLRQAVSTLKKGELFKGVIATGMGFHVVKVENDKTIPAPSFDEAKKGIEVYLRERQIKGLVHEQMLVAKVENLPAPKAEVKAPGAQPKATPAK